MWASLYKYVPLMVQSIFFHSCYSKILCSGIHMYNILTPPEKLIQYYCIWLKLWRYAIALSMWEEAYSCYKRGLRLNFLSVITMFRLLYFDNFQATHYHRPTETLLWIITREHCLETLARICNPFREPTNRFPARLHRLTEAIPWNRFLVSLKPSGYTALRH